MLALFGGTPTVTAPLPEWPRVGDEEISAVERVLRSGDVTGLTSIFGGGVVAEFESALKSALSSSHALTTNSGWAALHTALVAVGVEAGDEVIVPAYTWGQSASCVLQQNAIPVFADIDVHTYTLSAETVTPLLSPHTKAIVVVHLYGQPADLTPLLELARERQIAVIEDCAQAAGATYCGRPVGTLGDVGCFSIGSGKQIVGGEGGFLLTQSEDIYRRALAFSQHPQRQRVELGDRFPEMMSDTLLPTYRIHPLAAAIAGAQLPRLDEWNNERIDNLHLLSKQLENIPGVVPVVERGDRQHVFHLYCPTYDPDQLGGLPRHAFVEALVAEGAPVRAGYVKVPLHLTDRMDQRRFTGRGVPWCLGKRDIVYRSGMCPVTENRCAETDLSIFLGANAVGDQTSLIKQVANAFAKVAEHHEALLARDARSE